MKRLLLFVTISLLWITSAHAKKSYVNQKATGLNNGSSWDNAYTTLDIGLQNGYNVDTIWVAQGVYSPDEIDVFSNHLETFTVRHNITLLGGFKGDEETISDRDKSLRTTLSGELGSVTDTTDNASHVLTIKTRKFTIDGFVIRDGYGVSFHDNVYGTGAGIYASPWAVDTMRVSNCDFYNNVTNSHCHPSVGEGGAAITGYEMKFISITKCNFENNRARNFYAYNNNSNGGAITMYGCDSIIVDSCIFSNNSSDNEGGAIYMSQSASKITNSVFTGNKALKGGAIVSHGLIENCTLKNNHANSGGAIYNTSGYRLIKNSIIQNNSAIDGGALYLNGDVVGCTITGNSAEGKGGAIYFNGGEVKNSIICNNSCDSGRGGAIYRPASGSYFFDASLSNVTISGNRAKEFNGLYVEYSTYITKAFSIKNAIIWGNGDDSLLFGVSYFSVSSKVRGYGVYKGLSFENSILENPYFSTADSNYSNVLYVNPLFKNAEAGDFSLLANSPAIDAGVADSSVDYNGNFAYDDSSIANHGTGSFLYKDIGAVEFIGKSVKNDLILKTPIFVASQKNPLTITVDSVVSSGTGVLSLSEGVFDGYKVEKSGSSYIISVTTDSLQPYKIDFEVSGKSAQFILLTDVEYVASDVIFRDGLSLDENGMIFITPTDYTINTKAKNSYVSKLMFATPDDSNYVVKNEVSTTPTIMDKNSTGDSLTLTYYLCEYGFDKGGVFTKTDSSDFRNIKIARKRVGVKYFVDPNSTGGNGLSWQTAISLKEAYGKASTGDTIWLKKGEYVASKLDSLEENGTAHYYAPSGITLFGGFKGNETAISQRDLASDSTKIYVYTTYYGNFSANGIHSYQTFSGYNNMNVHIENSSFTRLFTAEAFKDLDSIATTFVLKNSTLRSSFSERYFSYSSVSNCIFDNVSNTFSNTFRSTTGVGVLDIDSSSFINFKTTFTTNVTRVTNSSFDTAPIQAYSMDSLIVKGCVFLNSTNSINSNSLYMSESEFYNCVNPIYSSGNLYMNRVKVTNSYTAGSLIAGTNAHIENSIIAYNSIDARSNVNTSLLKLTGKSELVNSTVVGNMINGKTAIYSIGVVNVDNSIIFNENENILKRYNDSAVTFTNSILNSIDTLSGTGNIEGNPLLDPITFTPLSGSKAIDGASTTVAYPLTDYYAHGMFDDIATIGASIKDIGAVERGVSSTSKKVVAAANDTINLIGVESQTVSLTDFSYAYSDGSNLTSAKLVIDTLNRYVDVTKVKESEYTITSKTNGDLSTKFIAYISDLGENSPAFMVNVKVTPLLVQAPKDTLFVDLTKKGDGSSWADACSSFTDAAKLAKVGDVIWVKKGEYFIKGNIILKDSVEVYGGFNGDENSIEEREENSYSTIVGSSASSYHLLIAANRNSIDGFVFSQGYTYNYSSGHYDHGGAIVCDSIETISIKNCHFTDNSAYRVGAGVYLYKSKNINIDNCTFTGNYQDYYTLNFCGSVSMEYCENSSITNCTFENNSAGGIAIDYSIKNYVANCTFIKNRNAIYARSSGLEVESSLFTNNVKDWGGAGVFVSLTKDDPIVKVSNCTFYDNIAMYNSTTPNASYASVYFLGTANGKAEVTNNIFWRSDIVDTDNRDVQDKFFSGELLLKNNTIFGDTLANNFTFNPLFVDAENGDFTLDDSSKCINAGDTITLKSTKDLAGENRVFAKIDLGAYENQYVDSIPLDTNTTGESIYFSPFDSEGNAVRIGPNPITEDSKIFVQCDDMKHAVVKIYNENAKVIFTQKALMTEETHGRASLQRLPGTFIQNMNSGTYWIVLEKDGEILSVSDAYRK